MDLHFIKNSMGAGQIYDADSLIDTTIAHVLDQSFGPVFAAAPDMLEALKNIENDDNQIPRTAWDMIQAAIAKAEGK